jgi:hypothetical protein
MHYVLSFVVIMLPLCLSQQADLDREQALRKQTALFYSHFAKGEYDAMWDMLARESQESNDSDIQAYVTSLNRMGIIGLEARIGEVRLTGDQATVKMHIRVESKNDKPPTWKEEDTTNTWILEEDQ